MLFVNTICQIQRPVKTHHHALLILDRQLSSQSIDFVTLNYRLLGLYIGGTVEFIVHYMWVLTALVGVRPPVAV